jgi:hypothetical protein
MDHAAYLRGKHSTAIEPQCSSGVLRRAHNPYQQIFAPKERDARRFVPRAILPTHELF